MTQSTMSPKLFKLKSITKLPGNTPFSASQAEDVRKELLAGNTLMGIYRKCFAPLPLLLACEEEEGLVAAERKQIAKGELKSGGVSWFYDRAKKFIMQEPGLKKNKNREEWTEAEVEILWQGKNQSLTIDEIQKNLPGRSFYAVKNKFHLAFSRRKEIEPYALPWEKLKEKGLVVVNFDQWPGLKTEGPHRLLVLITPELMQNAGSFEEAINNLLLDLNDPLISHISFHVVCKETIQAKLLSHPAQDKFIFRPSSLSQKIKSLVWAWTLGGGHCNRTIQGHYHFGFRQAFSPCCLYEGSRAGLGYFLKMVNDLDPKYINPGAISICRSLNKKRWYLTVNFSNWDLFKSIYVENYSSLPSNVDSVRSEKKVPSLEVVKKYFTNAGLVLAHLFQLYSSPPELYSSPPVLYRSPPEEKKDFLVSQICLQIKGRSPLYVERIAEAILCVSGLTFFPIRREARGKFAFDLELKPSDREKFIDIVSPHLSKYMLSKLRGQERTKAL